MGSSLSSPKTIKSKLKDGGLVLNSSTNYGDLIVNKNGESILFNLKVIIKEKSDKESDKLNKLKEISNESVCKYVEVIPTKEYVFILSELFYQNLEGVIEDNIKRKYTPSEDEASKLLYEISKGLYYLHKNEIIHRNIRPNNIYIKDDIYKVGGYGIEKDIDMSGIRNYKEIFIDNEVKESKESKKENDIYSLGKTILYYYKNGNVKSIYDSDNNDNKNKLSTILLKCINIDVKLRPTIVELIEYIKTELNINSTEDDTSTATAENVENKESEPSQEEQPQSNDPVVVIPEFVKMEIGKDFMDLVDDIKMEGKNPSNDNLQKLLDYLSKNNGNNNNINYIRNLCRYLSEKGMINSLCKNFENSDTKGGYIIAGIFAIICALESDLIKNEISLICAVCVYCLQQGAIIGLKLLQPLLYHYENTVKNGFPNYIRLMIPYINMRNRSEVVVESLRMSYILIDHHSENLHNFIEADAISSLLECLDSDNEEIVGLCLSLFDLLLTSSEAIISILLNFDEYMRLLKLVCVKFGNENIRKLASKIMVKTKKLCENISNNIED